MTVRESVRARRKQRRRRKIIAVGVAAVVVAGGAGTAWATNRSNAPHYRLATVTTGAVSQVVAADGSLAAARVADASFAVSGTVSSVGVAVGDRVRAGQVLATMDKSSLDAAVASAQTSVASANETLTDDEDGISTSSTSGSSTGGTATGTTGTAGTTGTTDTVSGTATTKSAVTHLGDTATAVFTAARTATPTPGGGSSATGSSAPSALSAAQAKVSAAAKALAKALNGELDTVAAQCAAVPTTVTSTVIAAADSTGVISGSTGSDTTSVTAGGQSATFSNGTHDLGPTWTLSNLTPATTYTVTITQRPQVVDAAACSTAVQDAGDDSSNVAKALTAFNAAVAALQKAASTSSSGSAGTSGSSKGSSSTGSSTKGSSTKGSSSKGSSSKGSSSTGSSTKGNSSSGSSTGTTATGSGSSTTVAVTSEKLAADVAAVGAAKAALAVAKNQLAGAALTSPVTGTVASVGLTKGASVSAGSSSATIEVVADGPLSVQLSIPLSKIDLIKVGQVAHVTVDGRSAALPAAVTYVGLLNSSTSTGSSSTYTVTVQLAKAVAGLLDGMGAQVSIDVGTADNVLVIPLSALHTTGTRQTVDVYSGGTSTPTSVTVGVVGASSVQIKSGLKARQQVVLADTSEAIPSSSTTTGIGNRAGFGARTFGGGGGAGGFAGGGR